MHLWKPSRFGVLVDNVVPGVPVVYQHTADNHGGGCYAITAWLSWWVDAPYGHDECSLMLPADTPHAARVVIHNCRYWSA